MTIEQHAEAAVREYWDAANKADGHGKAMTHYIAKHMQSAIDETTAPLKARIAELEGLGELIEEILNFAGDVAAMPVDEGIEQYRTKAAAILKGGAK